MSGMELWLEIKKAILKCFVGWILLIVGDSLRPMLGVHQEPWLLLLVAGLLLAAFYVWEVREGSRRIRAGLALLVALGIGFGAWYLPQLNRPTVRLLSRDLEILSPTWNQEIGRSFDVTVSANSLIDRSRVWLFVLGEDRVFPEVVCGAMDGNWKESPQSTGLSFGVARTQRTCTTSFGNYERDGGYEVVVGLVNEAARKTLNEYREGTRRTNDYSGIVGVPPGVTVLARVPVRRVR